MPEPFYPSSMRDLTAHIDEHLAALTGGAFTPEERAPAVAVLAGCVREAARTLAVPWGGDWSPLMPDEDDYKDAMLTAAVAPLATETP